MTKVSFYQVNALPGTLQPNSLYFVLNGNYSESYLTNSSGVAKSIGNSAMINERIDARMNALGLVRQVATIAARNTDKASTNGNTMYLVTDATGDATVSAGAALYFYNKTADAFTKVAEYESMDVVLQWANLQGRPNSTPAAIDDTVGKAHTHANAAVLSGLGDTAGKLTYGGTVVGGGEWGATDW